MALRTHITERQRRLGVELKRLRLAAGLSIAKGGELIGMGTPHLSHIEAGRTAIPTERLRKLVHAYGCKNDPYIDALVSMSESNGKGWWTEYRKTFPQFVRDLAELEFRSTSLQSYETLLIPGMLQTESYMRALFRSLVPHTSSDEVEDLVRFRSARQEVVRRESATTFHAVIHEAALRMMVGGSHVMRGQLIHLIRMSKNPGVTIQVLPFDMGVRSWFSTPFLILGAVVPELETVSTEQPSGSLWLRDAEAIAQYRATFSGLSKNALPPVVANESPELHEERDSWGLIHHILYTH
ncbi:helix-turn-helix domain-containing protein [Streptomyces zagrosensis]|uniref:Transcriptional regulator with XRE-family HTH domain n=1 Tax=Streptomyces zagrosensis TaxID=1042984 RepID=A0A7W9V314_9ACTN|nr:helix-turn-helix transcriptional regulator [Streptomyces zagrosensis]MBB5939419.1 transcriptional regulator with XRE-family HTH domain [Streptomyces zagrosensis]